MTTKICKHCGVLKSEINKFRGLACNKCINLKRDKEKTNARYQERKATDPEFRERMKAHKDKSYAKIVNRKEIDGDFVEKFRKNSSKSRLKTNLEHGPHISRSMRNWLSAKLVVSRTSRSITRLSKHPASTTIEQLMELYEKQNGRCAITNLAMTHVARCPYAASIDRIDSNKTYELFNIQLVCTTVNLAKNSYSDDEIRKWFQDVKLDATEHHTMIDESRHRLLVRRLLNKKSWRFTTLKKIGVDRLYEMVTIDQLVDMYYAQQGKCAITNLSMTHVVRCPYSISIDRIDSSGVYEVNNIQLVCTAVNLGKGPLSDERIREWIKSFKTTV